jgi:glycosyltransferase involved in cell wall biosynthesis
MLAHAASASRPLSAIASIIIPVRNAEPYLNDCIQSVLDQTSRPLQICAHDDGSSDGSLALLLQWQRKISEEHSADVSMVVTSGSACRGVGGARNAAIASSSAEWLCFLDADDIMRPNRITLQASAFRPRFVSQAPHCLLQLEALAQLGAAGRKTIMGGNFSRLPTDATPRYLSFHQSLRSDDLNFMWAVSFRHGTFAKWDLLPFS